MERVAKGSLIAYGTEVLLRLKGLVVLPVLTKTFGSVEYGVWAQVVVIVGLVSPVVTCGLDSAASRFLAGGRREDVREGFYGGLGFVITAAAIAAVLIAVAAKPVAGAFFDGAGNATYVVLAAAFMFASVVRGYLQKYFRLVLDMKVYSAANVFAALSNACAVVAVAAAGGGLMTLVIVTVVLEALLALALGAVVVSRLGVAMPRFIRLREMLSFGLPLVPAGWFIWVLNVSDRFFVSYHRGLAEVGVYAVAYNLGLMLMQVFFNPVWITFPPAAAELHNRGRSSELRDLTRYTLKYGLLVMVPATVAFSVLARPILTALSTAEFARGAYLVPLVAGGYLLSMVGAFPMTGLELARKTKAIMAINLGAAGVNVGLNAALVPPLGMTGAAIATFVAFGLQFALSWKCGGRYLGLELHAADALRIASVTGTVAAVALLVRRAGGADLAVAIMLVVVAFCAAVVLSGSIGAREREYIARLLSRPVRPARAPAATQAVETEAAP